jgi:hypothetical protein
MVPLALEQLIGREVVLTDSAGQWETLPQVRRYYRGPRDVDSMVEAGLFPELVGARFLTTDGTFRWDTISLLLMDPDSENVDLVLLDAAHSIATRRGKGLASRVVDHRTRTTSVFSGLPVFESKVTTNGREARQTSGA